MVNINRECELTLSICESLLVHCFDQQFVKQTLIRSNTSEILRTTLRIHATTCPDCAHGSICHLLTASLQSILRQSWNVAAKFSFLNIFIRALSVDIVRQHEPQLNAILLQTMQQYSLSTYACDTLISLAVAGRDSSVVTCVVGVFDGTADRSLVDIESIRTVICECLLPKLARVTDDGCRVIGAIIDGALARRGSAVARLVLACRQQLLAVRLVGGEDEQACRERAAVDSEEAVRMQAGSVMCLEIAQRCKAGGQAVTGEVWRQLRVYVIANLPVATNKFRQHFGACFRPLLEGVVVRHIADGQAASTRFIGDLLGRLVERLVPGASFYVRSSVIAYLEMIFTVVGEERLFGESSLHADVIIMC